MRQDKSSAATIVAIAIGWFLLLPAVYALSLGPMLSLTDRGYVDGDTFDRLYWPLFAAAEITGLHPLLVRYAQLWP